MADLLTTAQLATWTQNDPTEVAADPWALEVITVVSQLAQFLGGHEDWSLTPGDNYAPFDVRLVVLQVAKRAYQNPDQVVSENVGPLGERRLDVNALLFDLTDSERATLTRYNPEGDPNTSADDGLWVQPTTRGEAPDLIEPVLYVPDNQQINISEDDSAWPTWDIPMFSPGDPGDPNNYPDEG